MGMTLSINGLYLADDTIFDLMLLPEDMESDRDTIVGNILIECSELEILYPDPAVIKQAIALWSAAEIPVWRRMNAAYTAEYDPLWNVDATITETGSSTDTKHGGEDKTSEINNSVINTIDNDSNSTVSSIDSSTAFNSGSLTQRDSNTSTTTAGIDETSQQTTDGTQTDTSSWNETNTGSDTRSIRRTGNIGVTSSQQLVMQEIEVAKINVMRYIIDSFKKRFCILVY